MADYQWYPGHMTKARRMMQENLSLVDVVIEIVDSRIPLSSRNPDIDKMAQGKSRILIMGKSDLADPERTEYYKKQFMDQGLFVVTMDSRDKKSASRVKEVIVKACQEKIERDRRRGIINRPIRCMICGIPNVGKSTFINAFAGKASAKTGNKPGVTKGKQWINVVKGKPSIDVLDTPGILWPKFEDKQVGIRLALVSAIREEILDETELSVELLKYLISHYRDLLENKYASEGQQTIPEEVRAKLDAGEELDGHDMGKILYSIADNRRMITKGQALDDKRASHVLLDDFKNGKIGRITLE